MKTREYMKMMYADNLDGWRQYMKETKTAAETLCEIVNKYRFNDGTPEQAAQEIAETIGKETACEIIASAVNSKQHDGRLSEAVKQWAQGIGWDWEMACKLGIVLDNIHMCHINQTAEALMNLPEIEPEQPETEPAEADETETEPETVETKEEEKTMYNYKNAMMNDILDHIAEEIDRADYIDNRDELEEKLNDELFVSDNVTGNASGSYYCNACKAREAVIADGFDYIREAVSDFGIEAAEIGERFINEDWEWLDVTIRCYLLGQMVNEVLDELEESGYFEESEIDETDIMQEVREAIA